MGIEDIHPILAKIATCGSKVSWNKQYCKRRIEYAQEFFLCYPASLGILSGILRQGVFFYAQGVGGLALGQGKLLERQLEPSSDILVHQNSTLRVHRRRINSINSPLGQWQPASSSPVTTDALSQFTSFLSSPYSRARLSHLGALAGPLQCFPRSILRDPSSPGKMQEILVLLIYGHWGLRPRFWIRNNRRPKVTN